MLLILTRESSFTIALLPISLVVVSNLVLLVRFGFLALVVQMTTYGLATWFPLTLNTEHWYFSHGLFAMAWIAVIAVYGFYTSLGGRSLFGPAVSQAG